HGSQVSGMHPSPQVDVRPSDFGQSLFRVVLVSAVIAWSLITSRAQSFAEAMQFAHFQFALGYWVFSLGMCAWIALVFPKLAEDSPAISATRVLCIFADVGANSFYTAITDLYGVVLFPIYITSIIGYGYRFG